MSDEDKDANPLYSYFVNNPGRLIHKWLHYFEPYHRHLGRLRGEAVTLVEFGVFHGGSLQMWKHYLGSRARIVGVDIDPACKTFEEDQVQIWIGDQEDRPFLRRLADGVGSIDIVIEDGGHRMGQQIATFEEIFYRMSQSGVYIAEDLHTSYWAEYGGGARRTGTFIEYAKALIDQLNAWHTQNPEQLSVDDFTLQATSMHFYDSMLIIERGERGEPRHTQTGRPSFPT